METRGGGTTEDGTAKVAEESAKWTEEEEVKRLARMSEEGASLTLRPFRAWIFPQGMTEARPRPVGEVVLEDAREVAQQVLDVLPCSLACALVIILVIVVYDHASPEEKHAVDAFFSPILACIAWMIFGCMMVCFGCVVCNDYAMSVRKRRMVKYAV